MKTIAIIIAAASVVASSSTAHADDRARAEAHFRSAEAHFQSGNYGAAISGYAESHKLFKAPILLFNIGLCHQKLGEKQQAVDKYREYLAAEPNGAKAAEARDRAATLEKLITAEKEAADQKKRAAIAELKADIARLGDDHAGRATAIAKLAEIEPNVELLFDLGDAHQSAGDKAAAIAAYDQYLASEGASRSAEARRRRDALDKDGPGNGNGGSGIGTGPVDTGPESPSLVLPLVATSAAFAALAVGGVFGFRSAGLRSELEENEQDLNPPLDNSDSRIADGERGAKIANTFFIISAATAVLSGYLWYRFISKSRESRAAPSLGLSPRPDGGAVAVEVRF